MQDSTQNSTEAPYFILVNDHEVGAINSLCHLINDWAEKKGWNDDPLAGLDIPPEVRSRIELAFKNEQHMLFVTEIAEGVEYLRQKTEDGGPAMDDKVPAIPGEHAELADLLIRVFHYAGKRGIDLGKAVQMKHAFNITRARRHGKKA